MEVGCREARAINPWLAIIPYTSNETPTLGVTAPVTLNDSGEWIDASEHKLKRSRLGSVGHTMRWRSDEETGRDNKYNKVKTLAGGCNGNNPGNNAKRRTDHPWDSSHLIVPWELR